MCRSPSRVCVRAGAACQSRAAIHPITPLTPCSIVPLTISINIAIKPYLSFVMTFS